MMINYVVRRLLTFSSEAFSVGTAIWPSLAAARVVLDGDPTLGQLLDTMYVNADSMQDYHKARIYQKD